MSVDRYERDTLLYGRLVGTVWCHACGDKGKRLGNVNRSDHGRIIFSTRTTNKQDGSAFVSALKAVAKRRIPMERPVPDASDVRSDSVHRVRCPDHGEDEIAGSVILSALRASRMSNKPAVLTVHHNA